MKNEFRIVEKKSLTEKGVLTFYLAQHRVRWPNEKEEPCWHTASEHSGENVFAFGDFYPVKYSSIKEAQEALEKCKKSLEIHQYENVVYQEPPVEN